MSETETPREDSGRAPTSGPGERLQAARIARGLPLEELAHQMHLSVGILRSLEDNRFEDITAPIFVKGYLRSYARIVELDEQDILDQYVREYMDGDPPIGSTGNAVAQRSRSRGRGRWKGLVILLLVTLLLGGWWFMRSQQPSETLSLDAASEAANPEPAAEAAPVPQPDDALAGEAARRLEALTPLSEAPATAALPEASTVPDRESAADTSGAMSAPSRTEQAPEQSLSAPDMAATDDAENAGSGAAVQPAAQATAEPVPEPAPADAGNSLQLRVTADTWADIRDARGNKRVYDLLRAGRQLKLDAEPPLRLFFGNGHGVELIWRGQPIDLENRIRADNTVRITLE